MFGWRARIGCIHPRQGQLHTSMIEMEKVMPEGVYLNDVFLDGPKSQAPEHLKVQHADGLLIAGGGTPVYEIVEALEMDIGKPVVAHNFAAAWNALSMAHVRQPIRGYGRLLTMF